MTEPTAAPQRPSSDFRTAVAEGRLLRAVRDTPGVRGDTITGTVRAHQVQHHGKAAVLVTREEGFYMTLEQWQAIAEGLHLDTNPTKK